MQILDVVFAVPGMVFDGETVHNKSLGGSESAGYYMAREMAAFGHRVTMFCNCERPGVYDDVAYMPFERWQPYVRTTPHDVCFVQRLPELYLTQTCGRLNYLWCHDMAMGRFKDPFRAVMWNVDQVLVLSDYMAEQYKDVVKLPNDRLWRTRNGIDLSLFPEAARERNRKQLIYSARPERGLDVLIDEIMPALWEQDPEFELMVFGYDNPVEHMREFYGSIAAKIDAEPRIHHGGHLTKAALYETYAQAGVYVYPTPSPTQKDFREISCITAMECQAAGLPIVTSAIGALPETIAHNAGEFFGPLDGTIDEAYVNGFVDAIIRYATVDEVFERASKAGRAHAKSLGWDALAKEWTAHILDRIAEQNDDPVRLAHHFYRRSDIFAAEAALELADEHSERANYLRDIIAREYAFKESPEALREHYREAGEETAARLAEVEIPEGHFDGTTERRFAEIANLLNEQLPEDASVLEFGCGHGWSTIFYANTIGRKWTGVDIDPGAIATAERFRDAHAFAPGDLEFFESDESIDFPDKFDCLLVSDVLEHTVDPITVMNKLEKLVKPGGLVVITTPYGPVEYGTYNWIEFRNHLWEFDIHDLSDMFGHKPKRGMTCAPIHFNGVTMEPQGFYLMWWEAGGEDARGIDLARKLRHQVPRHTVSANVIAGPGAEKSILWALDSVRWVVDEIVIADTGLNSLAYQMVKHEYQDVRFINSVDPKKEGFETPRNHALMASRMDMVLWIDTDENLVDAQTLPKNCKDSMWHGFGIRQHHFSTDSPFDPDMPVRLFRRRSFERDQIRFYGMIHEHPELDINKGPGSILVLGDVHIAHVGYLSENIRKDRFKRNTPMMEADAKKYPDRLLHHHFTCRDLCLITRYEYRANGGTITPEMQERAEQVVEIYKKHFHCQSKFVGIDTNQYYTEALTLLGRGIDVTYEFGVQRSGIGDQLNGGYRARFEDADEAKEAIAYRLSQQLEPFETKEW